MCPAVSAHLPDKMNEKAASLGCTHTHFANPNGLNNANHFTTAHDMALIANAAFNNATVRQVASTLHYDFPATASVPTVPDCLRWDIRCSIQQIPSIMRES